MKETSDMALADYERQRESELAELREQLWAEQQAAKALRDRLEGGRKVLEERAADITGLKVWELECGGGGVGLSAWNASVLLWVAEDCWA